MEKKAQTLSAMGARSRVIEVYEASEKAGDVAVVLGSAIEKLSTAADKGCKLSSADPAFAVVLLVPSSRAYALSAIIRRSTVNHTEPMASTEH